MARTLITRNGIGMLNKSGEIRHSCLIPDLTRNTFIFSLLSMTLAVGLSYLAFVMLRYVPFVPTSLKVLIINGC